MEFNTLVRIQLLPILRKYGFEIAEDFKNIVRFQSTVMMVNIVFNNYDKSHLVELGRLGESLYPLNNNAIKVLFSSELSIEQVTSKVFTQNLSLLFEQQEGVEMLKGNLEPLGNFTIIQSEHYTSELIQRQELEIASKAWKEKDYKNFVESINKMGIDKVPQSYKLKYKLAIQRL
jgi:hypothetical protein